MGRLKKKNNKQLKGMSAAAIKEHGEKLVQQAKDDKTKKDAIEAYSKPKGKKKK